MSHNNDVLGLDFQVGMDRQETVTAITDAIFRRLIDVPRDDSPRLRNAFSQRTRSEGVTAETALRTEHGEEFYESIRTLTDIAYGVLWRRHNGSHIEKKEVRDLRKPHKDRLQSILQALLNGENQDRLARNLVIAYYEEIDIMINAQLKRARRFWDESDTLPTEALQATEQAVTCE